MFCGTHRFVGIMRAYIPHLLLAMCLASGRTVASKKISGDIQGADRFFLSQIVLFFSAGVLVAVLGVRELTSVSLLTVILGLVYGFLLVLSQWMLTLSLKEGNTSLCSVIYSLGFIIPTLSGAVIWGEPFTILNGIGFVVAILVILLSTNPKSASASQVSAVPVSIYIAMLASGGLGLMQKVQQSSRIAGEKMAFFLVAFVFAVLCSCVAYLICRKPLSKPRFGIMPIVAGLCFGGSNVCNTMLAGVLPSAVFFPVQNISTIILSTLLGILLFRERMTARNAVVLLLGILVIALFSVSF